MSDKELQDKIKEQAKTQVESDPQPAEVDTRKSKRRGN